jgi:hypothetical protein
MEPNMQLSVNTLRLLKSLLDGQSLSIGAGRDEIEAILTAKDELDDAVAVAELRAEKPEHNGRVTKPPARKGIE